MSSFVFLVYKPDLKSTSKIDGVYLYKLICEDLEKISIESGLPSLKNYIVHLDGEGFANDDNELADELFFEISSFIELLDKYIIIISDKNFKTELLILREELSIISKQCKLFFLGAA